jgi:hypothetical protein
MSVHVCSVNISYTSVSEQTTMAAGIRPADLHRVYIQCLLARRYMREDLALEMYKRAIGAVRSE